MIKETDAFYLNQKEPNQSCFLALRSIILKLDMAVTETQKYGMPCFCYGKKPFCYIWTDKKTNEPYILLVEGQQLIHPELETGNRKRMKILRINPNRDIPVGKIELILKEAIELNIKNK